MANWTSWPSTFATATSRSQSRASNSRMMPNAAERMTRLRPDDRGAEHDVLRVAPISTHAIATRVRDDPDHEPQPDVGADDPARGSSESGADHVAQDDPAQPQVGDEADDPEQRDDERVATPLATRELADDDDRPDPAERGDDVAADDEDPGATEDRARLARRSVRFRHGLDQGPPGGLVRGAPGGGRPCPGKSRRLPPIMIPPWIWPHISASSRRTGCGSSSSPSASRSSSSRRARCSRRSTRPRSSSVSPGAATSAAARPWPQASSYLAQNYAKYADTPTVVRNAIKTSGMDLTLDEATNRISAEPGRRPRLHRDEGDGSEQGATPSGSPASPPRR